jgi:hypothetical protein
MRWLDIKRDVTSNFDPLGSIRIALKGQQGTDHGLRVLRCIRAKYEDVHVCRRSLNRLPLAHARALDCRSLPTAIPSGSCTASQRNSARRQ